MTRTDFNVTPFRLRGEGAPLSTSSLALLGADVQATADGILAVHRSGDVVTYNRRFLELWRIPPQLAARSNNAQLISLVLEQLVDPGTFLRVTRENQANSEREYFSVLRFKDGRMLERFSTPRRVSGELVGRVIGFRDVTDRERLLEQARALLRAQGAEFEAQAPALRVAVQSLLLGELPTEIGGGVLEVADREELQLTRLLDELLALQRIRAGELEIEAEPVDLVGVACEVAQRHAIELIRSGSALELHAPAPVVGYWSRAALQQILSNLLSNAIRFGASGPIQIRIAEQDGAASIAVQDRGSGIAQEIKQLIFEPRSRAAAGAGRLGLGLCVVRTVAELLGGSVHVESRPGHGTCFEVRLPRRPPAAE